MSAAATTWRAGLFDGRALLVAGAGPGGVIARCFEALGATVEQVGGGDAAHADASVASALQRHGALATLVTLATELPEVDDDPLHFDATAWRDGVDRTLNSSWFFMHAAARQWRDRQQPGQIIAVMPPYRHDRGSGLSRAVGASLAHLVKTVAVEWAAHRIRVNGIALSQPDDPAVTDAAVWLAADSGKFVTGEVMHLGALV